MKSLREINNLAIVKESPEYLNKVCLEVTMAKIKKCIDFIKNTQTPKTESLIKKMDQVLKILEQNG